MSNLKFVVKTRKMEDNKGNLGKNRNISKKELLILKKYTKQGIHNLKIHKI